MADIDHERLTRLLGDPSLEWLLERARRRLELEQPFGAVTLKHASTAQRDAVERLLGRRPRAGRDLTVSLLEVDNVLRRAQVHPDGLAAAVIALTGPVSPRAAVAAAEREAWERAFAKLSRAVADRPQAAGWLERLHGTGLVKRLAGDAEAGRELLDRLARIAGALPARGEHLGSFAARTAGRAHALDEGEPLGALALGLARALSGLEPPAPGESPAESRREAWAAVGILCDELSNAVLVLGLAADEQSATGRMLELAREAGQPVWLTLRQLVRDPPELTRCLDSARYGSVRDEEVPERGVRDGAVRDEEVRDRGVRDEEVRDWGVPDEEVRDRGVRDGGIAAGVVHVCENPSILALAADAFGPRCPPLVCLCGQPSAATMLLLRSLVAVGARLSHHGDFDWGGVRIGNVLRARLAGITPWQFDRASYLEAVSAHPGAGGLSGEPVVAGWDSALSDEMCHAGKRIEEEMVADSLLSGLASAAAVDAPSMFAGLSRSCPKRGNPAGSEARRELRHQRLTPEASGRHPGSLVTRDL